MSLQSNRWQTGLLFVALILGVAVGQMFHQSANPENLSAWWSVGGEMLLLRPLQMIVVPLVVLSVASGIASIGDPSKLGIIGSATMAFYVASMLLAAALGATAVEIFQPGAGISAQDLEALTRQGGEVFAADATRAQRMVSGEAMGLTGAWQSILSQLLPKSPLAEAASGNTVGVISFSILLGLGLAAAGESARVARDVVNGLLAAILRVIRWILWLMPIGLFLFVTSVVAKIGIGSASGPVGKYFVLVLIALILHGMIVLPLMGLLLGGGNCWKLMWRVRRALYTAFSTSSSNATLPVTLEVAASQGQCSKRACSFVIPIGATINMDGTALYEAVAALFLFQLFGAELTFGDNVIVVMTATLAAIGAAGIPSAGLVTLVIVITAVNTSLAGRGLAPVPVAAVGIIIGVDRLVDMVRTTVNVWGDIVAAKVITKIAPDPA
ncbi:MAG: dicarboxylate/amino acid:cation symporter [Planctomycetota bacterium]|jgi:Na+/H+-dicarboxylate symporter|nr:MAG: dicarboxylate/amino acid:cation symporter [Planctomycetota bacterium]